MRAHTDALCLMSRWHFCSPSPPHRLSLTGNEWAERKSQRKERGKRGQMRVWEEIQHCLHFTQGHKPQTKSRVRVHGRASQSGGGQVWARSGFSAQESPWWFCPDAGRLAGSSCASQSFPFFAFLSFWYRCLSLDLILVKTYDKDNAL